MKQILIVDDEESIRVSLSALLSRHGYHVTTAPGGAEALDILAEQDIDMAFVDVRMPGMDGIEALREIKRRHPLIEVIMLTGHANVETAIQGMELGAFDYLMKPMDIDELLYKLQDAYKSKSLREQRIKRKESEGLK